MEKRKTSESEKDKTSSRRMEIKLQNKMKRFQQGKVSGALKVDTFMYLLIGKEYKHKYKTLLRFIIVDSKQKYGCAFQVF